MNTDKWTTDLDRITEDFRSAFGNLSHKQLNWKPHDSAWSIAQNIDHLIVTNESYYPVVNSIRNNTYKVPFMGRFGFMTNLLGKTILNSVHPDRRRKIKTFPIWEPTLSEVNEDVIGRFAQHQDDLKALISNCSDLLDKGTVVSSPANKNIVYKLETAFDILVTHEKRHFEQAKDMMSLQQK